MTLYHHTQATQEVKKLSESVNDFESQASSMLDEMLIVKSYARRVVDICLEDLGRSELPLDERNRIERFMVAYALAESVHASQTRTQIMGSDHKAFESLQAKVSFAVDSGFWRSPKAVMKNYDPVQACLDLIESDASQNAEIVDPERPLFDFVLNYINDDVISHARNLLCTEPGQFQQFLALQLQAKEATHASWNSADSLIADFLAFPQNAAMTDEIFTALDTYLMQDPVSHARRVGMILEIALVLQDMETPSVGWTTSTATNQDSRSKDYSQGNVQRMLVEEYSSTVMHRLLSLNESNYALASMHLGASGINLSDMLNEQIGRLTQQELQAFLVDLREGVANRPDAATAIVTAGVIPTCFECAIDHGNSAELKTEIFHLSQSVFTTAQEKSKFLAVSYRTLLSLASPDDAASFAEAVTLAFVDRKQPFGLKSYDTLTADLLLQLREAAISSDKMPTVIECMSGTLIKMLDPANRISFSGIKKAINNVLGDITIVASDPTYSIAVPQLGNLIGLLNDPSRTGLRKTIPPQRAPRTFSQRVGVQYGETLFGLDIVAHPRDLAKAFLGAIGNMLQGINAPSISLQIPRDQEIIKRLSHHPKVTQEIHKSLHGGSYFVSAIPLDGDGLMNDDAAYSLNELQRALKLGRLNYHHLNGLNVSESDSKLPPLDLAILHCGPQGELPGWPLEKGPRLESSLAPVGPGRYDLLVGLQRIFDAKRVLLVVDSTVDTIVKDRILVGEPSNDCPASCLKAVIGDKLHIVMQRPYFVDIKE
jgi:hypothetical protein